MTVKELLKKLFSKESILTVPNLLTLVRFALIPLILYLYCVRENYPAAAAVVVLSGLTDIADGMIARKCNMTSDFGKLMDPVADKLTQGAMIVSMLGRYGWMVYLLGLFLVKEGIQGVYVAICAKSTGEVNSSCWYGKVSTVTLYSVMFVLFLFPGIPEKAAMLLCLLCAGMLTSALLAYIRLYLPGLRASLKSGKENKENP